MLIALTSKILAQDLVPSPGILANDITNLAASGDFIWVGPYLNRSPDGGATWQAANVEALQDFTNSIYSINITGQSIWAGVGHQFNQRDEEGELQRINEVRGLLYSPDQGNTWIYRLPTPPSDNDPLTTGLLDLPGDTLVTYGSVTLSTLPITVPAQSPVWDIDFDEVNQDVWIAGQLAGLRRSTDLGQTWERIVLPPDTTSYLAPELGYDFPFKVQPAGIAPALFHGLNFQAFSVLVDDSATIWAGTAGGLNRSVDGGIRWHHYTSDDGLLGNWIISIEEQLRKGKPPAVWATNWPGLGRGQGYGISVTRDGGVTFQTALHGEQCYDFAFDGPRIYVACDRGLYRSIDDGSTFFVESDFIDRSDPARSMRPGARVYSVAVSGDAVWVGSQDGLFKSLDQGGSWEIFRAQVPIDPANLPSIIPADRVPRVSTYAYPNPFSPSSDRLIRLRYDVTRPQAITARIFDFSMTLIRELSSHANSTGANELTWDGTDESGLQLANGPYFYAIQAQEETFWGKILIIQ